MSPNEKRKDSANECWRDQAKLFDPFQFLLHFYLGTCRGEHYSLGKLNASARTPIFPHEHELTLPPVLPGKPLMPGEPAGPGYPFRPVSPFAPMSPFAPAR